MFQKQWNNFELTELFGARDASCPKGKKMYERQRKIEFVEEVCLYEWN